MGLSFKMSAEQLPGPVALFLPRRVPPCARPVLDDPIAFADRTPPPEFATVGIQVLLGNVASNL